MTLDAASEMPAGRFEGSPRRGPAVPAAPGAGATGVATTRFLAFVSTTTFLVRPCEKLCFTLPGRAPGARRPRGLLSPVSFM